MSRALGIWDVERLLKRMSAAQLGEWIAFYHAEAELDREAREQAALEAAATEGVREIRDSVRS